MALMFNNSPKMATAAAEPDGYGPVAGVLQIAPSPGSPIRRTAHPSHWASSCPHATVT